MQKRYWTPCLPRTAQEDRLNGKAADRASSITERKQIGKEKGVTGETIFYRLFDLCGFDPVKDLTIDAMHAIVLNLIRTELTILLADLGRNSTLQPSERDPSNGGLLDKQSLASAIQKVEWTPELKDGRIPTFCKDGQKLSYWKAEEFSKFILVAPVVLRKLIPRKAYDCFCLLKDISDLVYSRRLQIQGWHPEHHVYFKKLLWKHAILFEELYGLSACTENLEYSLHMTEDVKRHSLLDNYWCYLYERQVKYYKQQASNMKSLCKTFADRANQLLFTSTFLSTTTDSNEAPALQFQCLNTKPILLTASSVEEAISLKQHILNQEVEDSVTDHKLAVKTGIFLGGKSYHRLTEQELADLQHWIQDVDLPSLPTVCLSFSRIFKVNDYNLGVVYRTNEHAIVRDADDDSREWLTKITNFFVCGPINGSYHSFLKGKFFCCKDYSWDS